MAKAARFRTRAERLRKAHMEPREQLLLELEHGGVHDAATSRAARLYFEDQADSLFRVPAKWRFVMLGRRETADLDDWLYAGGSKRPHLASRLMLRMAIAARGDTGEVLATRAELAELCGALPRHVSTALGDLERGGAIRRVRVGRNVRVFLNSRLATGLPEGQREAAQAAERPVGVQLSLIEGGGTADGG